MAGIRADQPESGGSRRRPCRHVCPVSEAPRRHQTRRGTAAAGGRPRLAVHDRNSNGDHHIVADATGMGGPSPLSYTRVITYAYHRLQRMTDVVENPGTIYY